MKGIDKKRKKTPLVHPFVRILFIVGVDYGREKRKGRRTNGKSLLKITLRKITTKRPDVINEILYPVTLFWLITSIQSLRESNYMFSV